MDSKEMRRLMGKWSTGIGWPKRLEWIQIDGLRGWRNERFLLKFPIMAIVGENGVGKSTVLQCIAAVYKSKPAIKLGKKSQTFRDNFASDHFPDTAWDKITKATIRYSMREGNNPPIEGSLRKPGERWRGYKSRRDRQVVYVDLSRIQPISSRVGYYRLAKPQIKEKSFINFDKSRFKRFSSIMGREYQVAKMAYTNIDDNRPVPVLGHSDYIYSGFHQGAGETILAELLQWEIPEFSIVLIDEIESSLHPRLQRRLIRDLATLAHSRELQIVVTTHSPFILDELPNEARAHIVQSGDERKIFYGITPEFSMTKMDDVPQYECDLYVEDERSERFVIEIMAAKSTNRDSVLRCRTIKYGAASVGRNLGIMAHQNRFPRPSFVFLDGDQGQSPGCLSLPGDDAPEQIVFDALRANNWLDIARRIKRDFSDVADACSQAMSLPDHHEWIKYAANKLIIGSDTLWQVMCSEWANSCLEEDDGKKITQPIEDALDKILKTFLSPKPIWGEVKKQDIRPKPKDAFSSESEPLFEQSPYDAKK